jgi:hypothetical protein
MTKTSKPKLNADAAYENAALVSHDLVARLQELLMDLPAPDTQAINWGHVGDLAEINHRLAGVIAFMTGTEK